MIADEEINAEIDVTSDNLDQTSGKADYKSTFTYYADKNHNQKELVCRVEHRGYTQAQVAEKQNEAKLRLNVNYGPMAWTKPQTFYKMVIGQEAKIDVHIEANPKPDSAKWLLGNGTELPAGSSSDDGKFTSGVLVPGVSIYVLIQKCRSGFQSRNLKNKQRLTFNTECDFRTQKASGLCS